MPHTISERIRRWSRDFPSDVDFLDVKTMIDYLAKTLFLEYEPTKGAGSPGFSDRLRDWLDGASENDQKVLLRLVPKLFFVGPQELDTLYQMAFNGPIARWLIDQLDLRLDETYTQGVLRNALKNTWFCPITDSMIISKFHHVNRITGADLRSDWRTLQAFSNGKAVTDYMVAKDLRRLVLLEDFVGMGDQMEEAVKFAAALPGGIPVLICPIIICPPGIEKGEGLQQGNENVSFSPTFPLPHTAFITPEASQDEPPFNGELRRVLTDLHGIVSGTNLPEWIGPFGYRDTGTLGLMYTNCPDNVPPIVHHRSDNWTALFPRSSRL